MATQYPSPASWQYLFARWYIFRHVGYLRHQQQVDIWPFDLESGVRVTCDVGYLCANISLPRPVCSRVRPDVCDSQTDVRQKHRLMPPPYGDGGIIMCIWLQEYPFFTVKSLPPGFVVHLGGVVSARSVKLLDKIHNPGIASYDVLVLFDVKPLWCFAFTLWVEQQEG